MTNKTEKEKKLMTILCGKLSFACVPVRTYVCVNVCVCVFRDSCYQTDVKGFVVNRD